MEVRWELRWVLRCCKKVQKVMEISGMPPQPAGNIANMAVFLGYYYSDHHDPWKKRPFFLKGWHWGGAVPLDVDGKNTQKKKQELWGEFLWNNLGRMMCRYADMPVCQLFVWEKRALFKAKCGGFKILPLHRVVRISKKRLASSHYGHGISSHIKVKKNKMAGIHQIIIQSFLQVGKKSIWWNLNCLLEFLLNIKERFPSIRSARCQSSRNHGENIMLL